MTGPFSTPDPLKFGLDMPVTVRCALRTAWMTKDGWRIDLDMHADLKPYSLVDCQKPLLSAFGARVRRAIMRNGDDK